MRTRTSKVFARVFKRRHPGKPHVAFFFFPDKLLLLFMLKKIKPSADSKMIKLLLFDNLFPPLRHSRLRWLNTVLAVCECMSLAKSWHEKGFSSQAETWQVKNILMKDFY